MVNQILKHLSLGFHPPSLARHKLARHPLDEIISDRRNALLDQLLHLSDAIRSTSVDFFFHVAS